MAKKFKCPDCPPVGAPEYMLTYGDMMTLLVTFFVLLISFSSMQEAKFSSAMISLKGALGIMKADAGSFIAPQTIPMFEVNKGDMEHEIEELLRQLAEETEKSGTHEKVKVTKAKDRIHFRLSTPMLFTSGSNILKSQANPILELISKLLTKTPYEIRVEGHTDNRPMYSAKFPSNWELSAGRALSVVRKFVDFGVPAERFQVIGYGEYRPVATNDTNEGRELNRRVEIFINLKKDEKKQMKSLIETTESLIE